MDERVECPLAARVSCRKEPPPPPSRHAETRTCACPARSRVTQKKTPSAEGEKGGWREGWGGQPSAGRNFKFEHPLSIKSVPLPEGTASMPCCSYTNFINHASQHTGGGGYPAGSLCPSYIFAHEIRFRETHRATDDWRM